MRGCSTVIKSIFGEPNAMESQSDRFYWHDEADITVLSFVFKTASGCLVMKWILSACSCTMPSAFICLACSVSLALISHHTWKGKGEVSTLKTFLKNYCPDYNNGFTVNGASHGDLTEARQSPICALFGVPPATSIAKAWHQLYACEWGNQF